MAAGRLSTERDQLVKFVVVLDRLAEVITVLFVKPPESKSYQVFWVTLNSEILMSLKPDPPASKETPESVALEGRVGPTVFDGD